MENFPFSFVYTSGSLASAATFRGTVSISTEIPARAFDRVLEHVVEQLTSIEGADVNLTLEITAEIPSGIDNNKRRTLLENAANLGFSEKDIS